MAAQPTVGRRVSIAELCAHLAPTLGQEQSLEVVSQALRTLQLQYDELDMPRALDVLELLGRSAGMVGIASRFARGRLTGGADRALPVAAVPRPPVAAAVGGAAPPAAARGQRLPVADVVAALAPALGSEKSDEVVRGAMRTRGVAGESLSRDDVSRVLELVASQAGIVGVAARFALARLLLKLG